MWQLIINGPGAIDSKVLVGPEGAWVGRGKENQVVLLGHPISRRHGRFILQEGVLQFEDLGSRNGSRLNGARLKGTSGLKAGDVLHIGEFTLGVRRLARVDNLELSEPDLEAGAVQRFRSEDLRSRILLSRAARDSGVLARMEELAVDELAGSGVGSGLGTLILHADAAERVTTAEGAQHFFDELLHWLWQKTGSVAGVLLLRHRDGLLVPVSVQADRSGGVAVCDDVLALSLKKRVAVAVAKVGEQAQQVLCTPVGQGELPLGALYLVRPDREEEVEPFLDLCNAAAHVVQKAMDRYDEIRRVDRQHRMGALLKRLYAPELARAAVEEAARAGILPAPRLEAKPLVMLSAGLSGFTQVAERFGPERVGSLLCAFYECALRVLLSYGATVDRFDGAAVVAFFGAPPPQPDAAARALRTALALRTEWRRALRARPPQERCELRIGIHAGEGLVGTVGSPARMDYTALGEVVDLALALGAAAAPGQILVTQKVRRMCPDRFELTPVEQDVLGRGGKGLAALELLGEEVVDGTQRVPSLTD